MTNLGELHGVKSRPSTSPGGLKVVAIKFAPIHRQYFAICKKTDSTGDNTYVIEKLKRNGQFAKRTPETLWGAIFSTEGDAKRGLWAWDLA